MESGIETPTCWQTPSMGHQQTDAETSRMAAYQPSRGISRFNGSGRQVRIYHKIRLAQEKTGTLWSCLENSKRESGSEDALERKVARADARATVRGRDHQDPAASWRIQGRRNLQHVRRKQWVALEEQFWAMERYRPTGFNPEPSPSPGEVVTAHMMLTKTQEWYWRLCRSRGSCSGTIRAPLSWRVTTRATSPTAPASNPTSQSPSWAPDEPETDGITIK